VGSDTVATVLAAEYARYDRNLRFTRFRIVGILSLVLMLAGVSLDFFVYPDLLRALFWIRVLCDVATAVLLAFSFSSLGQRMITPLGHAVMLVPVVFMTMMIYVSEGAMSPYYAGLNLVFLGVGVLMPWSVKETLGFCLVTILIYSAACLLHRQTDIYWHTLFNNLYFLTLTAVVCITASYYISRRRFEEFRLRHELGRRNEELARSNEQLEELDRLKSEFFANVSHELRTPITLIISPLQDAIRNADLPSATRGILRIALDHSMRLLKLMNDLLDLIRVGKGKAEYKMQPIDLSSFVPGIVDSLGYLARLKRQQISCRGQNGPLMVQGDPDKLEKVLLNLLTNSMKFTPTGGTITARLHRDGSKAVVEVEDTGIGIPAKDLPFIFDRFRQVDGSSTRRFQGLGIGLALARAIVEEHKGVMRAQSEQGKGSILRVELPLCEGKAPQGDAKSGEENLDPLSEIYAAADRKLSIRIEEGQGEMAAVGTGEVSILVVEDEPDMRRFLVSLFSDEFKVLQAVDGLSGLATARKHQPDLALLDLMLPGMDGLELCKAIKMDPATSNMKVVLLTARVDEESKISALERGADDFITKPFSTTELRVRLSNLLRAAQLEEKVRKRNVELEDTLRRLKETEAQLVQSEKMNALGNLSAGLIHEINNPLNFTLTAIQVAVKEAQSGSPDLKETLEDIGQGMTRIRDIISDLRAFVHPTGEIRRQPFRISEAIETALHLVSHELRDLQVAKPAASERVSGSKNQVIQVFVNLLVNSSQALRSLPPDETRSPQIRISTDRQDGRLLVKVWDNGIGIDPKHLTRVCDPFFTTRDVGKGMGLGLSICHTIIGNHQGKITIESRQGEWTEVSFDLPLADQED
jgi:signal transduction histidine kinase